VLIAALASLGAGVGRVEASPVGSHAGSAKVNVTLVEFKLKPSVKQVAAGPVTFVVRNAGKLPHEFVVVRTKTPAGKLPTKGAVAVAVPTIGKIASFKPPSTKTLTLKLTAGHYALICNLAGHYKAGQFADLTVG
jgi:uncharacterized cupredoxin-like copper-binding protein